MAPTLGLEGARGPAGGHAPDGAEAPTLDASAAGASAPPAAWSPPNEFDDYVLVRLLGRGSTRAVYLAEDTLLAQHVAIKFVDAVGPGDERRERFLNEARAVDFGLARLVRGGPAAGVDRVRGTPHFMAPELWRAEAPTKRSDVYALGAVLYYLAAGSCVFPPMPLDELGRQAQELDALPLARRAPEVEARLAAIVDRCVRREPGGRFASGDELREALEQLGRRTASGPPPAGNPYRGLRAFDADHRALFFGCDAEAGVVLDRLRSEPLVAVTGDSGVGKSSLCRAGVVPAVREGALGGGRAWSVLAFSPGKRPLSALTTAVATLLRADAATLAHAARSYPAALADALGRRLGESGGLLLFIDQVEELITVSDPHERAAAEAAHAELVGGRPGVRVLAALRADFLTRFAALPSLGDDLARVLYFLAPALARARARSS